MASSNWHEEVQKALALRRLPPHYAQRLMDELLDHLSDLKEEYPTMESTSLASRLGSPEQLAQAAAFEYRRRTFAGRHPILTFLVAPIPSVVAFIAAMLLVLALVIWLIPDETMHGSRGITVTSMILAAVAWTLRVAPFAVAAVIFARAAARSGCDWRWGLAASLLLALFAGVWAVNYQSPTPLPDSGQFSIGLALPPGPIQIFQFSVPVTIAIWQARRTACRDSRRPVMAA